MPLDLAGARLLFDAPDRYLDSATYDLRLANRFREALGLAPADSAIVSAHIDGAEEKLARASIRAATRGGSLRAAFHLYNTDVDVDAAVAALQG